MKRSHRILISSLGLVLGAASIDAGAQTPPAEKQLSAREDRPEIRAQYEQQRLIPKVIFTPVERQILPDTRTTHTWILEAVIDRSALVSFEIPKGNEELLQGAVRVQRAEDVGHNTIWGGKYFRMIPIFGSALDDDSLQKFAGMPMKFDVAMRSDGRQVVLDIRRP